MRRAALALLVVIAGSSLWVGGETHRANCLERGRVGCSVWPWSSGHAVSSGKAKSTVTFGPATTVQFGH